MTRRARRGPMPYRANPASTVQSAVDWKKLLLVALVVLLVLIGLPLLMGGMGGGCADCGPAVIAGAACTIAAVLTGIAAGIALLALMIRSRRDQLFDLLRATVFERPPQFA